MPTLPADHVNANATHKKHITSACTCCRRRKVKCDGQIPSCYNCNLNKQICIYTQGQDKRKFSSKKTIQCLSDRVKLLEDLLRKNGIEIPPDDAHAAASPINESVVGGESQAQEPSRESSQDDPPLSQAQEAQLSALVLSSEWLPQLNDFHSNYLDAIGLQQSIQPSWGTFVSLGQTESATDQAHTFEGVHRDETGRDTSSQNINPTGNGETLGDPIDYSSTAVSGGDDEDDMRNIDNGDMLPLDLSFSRSDRPTIRRQSSIEWHNDNSWSQEHDQVHIAAVESERSTQDDEIVDQLSARMGSFQIAEDGQLRYFGATSNLHILHNGIFFLSRSPTRSIRNEGNDVLVTAGLGHTVSTETEKHLAKLYFKWEDPAIHVVDEEMYYLAQAKWQSGEDGSPFYSETLKNAICAIGATLTARTDLGLPESAAEFFSSRAKALLEIEMDSPTVATVQALVIMSAIEAAFTRDARGWLYSGMAVRLSADLGLHLDLSSHVRTGTLTSRELDVRRTAFWGVFIHDNMWSLYVGRPWGINIRDISISRPPKEMDQTIGKLWEHHSKIGSEINIGSESQGIYDPINCCADSNVSLCEMMRRLSRTLYAGRCLSNQELCDFATDMRQEFSKWADNLDPELKVNMSDEGKIYLPHVLQLHMQFHAISIFLHRPFFSRNIELDKMGKQVSNQARRVCVSAAKALVSLLRLYRQQHTLRRTNVQIVHLVFTASLIHIYNTCISTGAEAQNALGDLQFCCQALTEIGQAYKNSTRALEVLICIKREWQSKMYSRGLKRAISTADISNQRKKHITNGTEQYNPAAVDEYRSGQKLQLDQQSNGGTYYFAKSNQGDSGDPSQEPSMDSLFAATGFLPASSFAESPFALGGYLNPFPQDIDFHNGGNLTS